MIFKCATNYAGDVFLIFKKWENSPNTLKAILLSVVAALMFLGSYPGVFIATVYILLSLFVFRIFQVWKNGLHQLRFF